MIAVMLGLSALKVLFAVKEEDAIRFPDLSNLVAQLSVLSQQGTYITYIQKKEKMCIFKSVVLSRTICPTKTASGERSGWQL
jgi:hypothetical protein